MESLGYFLEDRRPMLLEDIEFPVDVLAGNKNIMWVPDAITLSDFEKNLRGLERETLDSIEFMDTVLPDRMRKSQDGNLRLGVQTDDFTDNCFDKVPSIPMINMDQFRHDLGFDSKLSDTAFVPNNQKESLNDLKLEKRNDFIEANDLLVSKDSLVSSMVETTFPVKRARTTILCSEIPLCQVEGCHKDLSSSKDYHKRHRVCDVHSKTAKVVINGIEQRFCQQCSRFHLLAEFDNGKRSCRKRLAGHNERRRKPQLSAGLGSRFFGMTLLKNASFFSPETFSSDFYSQETYINYKRSGHVRLEKVPIDISQLAIPVKDEQAPHESLEHLHSISKQHPLETCINAAIAVELSMLPLPDSCSALSLLSAKSQISRKSAGIPVVTREIHHAYMGIDQKSAEQLRTSTSESSARNGHFSTGIEGLLQISDCVNSKYRCSSGVGPTVDLLQLSSHLQRVEQQRTFLEVKQEDNTFCCSRNAQEKHAGKEFRETEFETPSSAKHSFRGHVEIVSF